MTKDQALAIAFKYLKGPRQKDYMKTAEALALLRSLPEYPSNAAVGKAVLVSGEIVREFIALTRLPPEIQQMFRDGLLRLEHGRRLHQLETKTQHNLEEVAEAIRDLPALEARDVVLYLIDHPHLSVEEAKQKVLDARAVVEDEYHVIAILNAGEFREVRRQARAARKSVSALVSSVIRDWLAQVRR